MAMRAVNTGGGKCAGWKAVLKGEAAFFTGVLCVLFFTFGGPSLLGLSGALLANGLSFAVIFSVMLWLSFGVVRHAECLAEKLGEPYGTLILTLAVISIEVVMITALMLTGAENPTLARDTMFSVLMIVLNGMVGITLLIGGLRHHQQIFNLEGARSYLAVILCLAFICLILPRFTLSGEGGSASPLFYGFLVVASVALYGVFLFLQSTRHRDFFQSPDEVGEGHGGHGAGSTTFHAVFLILSLLPIVLLSKKIAALLDFGLVSLGAPTALAGFVVALLVLAPEGLAAGRAALDNTLQRTVNIALGSALATIGLTVPAVLLVSAASGKAIELGLNAPEMALLAATFFCATVVFSGNRTNMLAGAVHLVLFAAYVVLIFD